MVPMEAMEEYMEKTKHKILDIWNRVPRPGIEDLVKFLQESDFFTAPCSTESPPGLPWRAGQALSECILHSERKD